MAVTQGSGDTPKLPGEAEWLLSELWLHVHQCVESEISDRQLRMVARLVGVCARKADMKPEALVIAVKGSWSHHEALRGPNERRRLDWVLNEVISSCIDSFYRIDAPVPAFPPSDERKHRRNDSADQPRTRLTDVHHGSIHE